MKYIILNLFLSLTILLASGEGVAEESLPKIVVLAFQLDDRTGLPNAPEELIRIELLTSTFKNQLSNKGLTIIPSSVKVQDEINKNSPSYLYENVETAADLNKDTNADYLVIGVAFKPTYLFVYPRLLIVDMKTKKVVMSKYAQLESSWLDQNTTIRTAEKLAETVKERLDLLTEKTVEKMRKLP
ncbi:DUF2380 domain-containing protein [Methylophilus flavus]|uniref:DUF2380 domain-containing protein n=1 Tax=Methylophilus flavus TaxID=640084 RepID=A0ABW3PGK7_9PROT